MLRCLILIFQQSAKSEKSGDFDQFRLQARLVLDNVVKYEDFLHAFEKDGLS